MTQEYVNCIQPSLEEYSGILRQELFVVFNRLAEIMSGYDASTLVLMLCPFFCTHYGIIMSGIFGIEAISDLKMSTRGPPHFRVGIWVPLWTNLINCVCEQNELPRPRQETYSIT